MHVHVHVILFHILPPFLSDQPTATEREDGPVPVNSTHPEGHAGAPPPRVPPGRLQASLLRLGFEPH